MKGKLKLLTVFLSLMVVCSLAVSVKAVDTTKSDPMITYTIKGEKRPYQDGREVYVNSVEVVFKVKTTDEIKKVEIFDTANDGVESYEKWSEIKLDKNNEYTVGTSRVGDYYFQLRVLDENNNILETSEQVKVTVGRFEEEKDNTASNETTPQEHEHQWDEENMIIKEPTLKNDGYAQIPCSVEGCDEYLELKLSLYSVEKEKYIFDSNKQKDMSFHINSQGILITVGIDDDALEEDQDYTVSEDGQTVTIKKERLAQLENGTYEISFIYLDMDYEALENMDIDNAEVEDLLKNMKMGVALTELEVVNTKPQPNITVDEEKEVKKEEKKKDESSPVTKQKETKQKKNSSQKISQENAKKIVQTDDDSPIIVYLGSMIIMGVALVALRRKKSA